MKESFSPLISFCEGKVSTTWLWDGVRIKKNSKIFFEVSVSRGERSDVMTYKLSDRSSERSSPDSGVTSLSSRYTVRL